MDERSATLNLNTAAQSLAALSIISSSPPREKGLNNKQIFEREPGRLTHPVTAMRASSGFSPSSPLHPPHLRRTNSEPAPEDAPTTPASAARKWFTLVRKGNYAGVQAGLREGWAPVNATDPVGYTALMRCCVSGQLLEVLLGRADVDVNLSNSADGATALLLAARHRSARTVHALLKRGATFTRDASGNSVLHKAAANADPAVVKLLLQAQADPCARDREGRCPLAAAVLHGNEATAIALLEWQQSWAAKSVLRAAAADAGRCEAAVASTTTASSSSKGPMALDGLPDDCLELVLQQLYTPSSSKSIPAKANATEAGAASSSSSTPSGTDSGDEAAPPAPAAESSGSVGGGGIVNGVNGTAIVASIAASVVAAASEAEHNARAHGGSRHGESSSRQAASSSAEKASPRVPAMACVCTRFRAVCRRRAVSAWLAVEGVNATVACFHPRGHQTTLLHVAAQEGMEATADLLLTRGARPLALDSSGRTPLQVARGRASLVAKLMQAQAKAEAEERSTAVAQTDDAAADDEIAVDVM